MGARKHFVKGLLYAVDLFEHLSVHSDTGSKAIERRKSEQTVSSVQLRKLPHYKVGTAHHPVRGHRGVSVSQRCPIVVVASS